MTTTALAQPRTSSIPRTAALLTAAIAVAGAANAVVALAAVAAGAGDFSPLTPPFYLAFTAAGVLGGYLGWRIVRRLFPNPARVLRVLVPVALVLSWVPDVMLGVFRFIPGATVTGAVGLAIMHAVVVAVAVPVYLRVAPVR